MAGLIVVLLCTLVVLLALGYFFISIFAHPHDDLMLGEEMVLDDTAQMFSPYNTEQVDLLRSKVEDAHRLDISLADKLEYVQTTMLKDHNIAFAVTTRSVIFDALWDTAPERNN